MLLGGLDLDRGVVVAEFDGVVHKVVKHLLYLVNVSIYQHFVICQHKLDGDILVHAGSAKRLCYLPDDTVDVKVDLLKQHSLGAHIVECKELVGELGKSVGLVYYYPKVLLMHLGRNGSILHCHKITSYGCKRRSEIVGNIGNQFLLIILGTGNLTCHVRQRSSKVSHLILRLHRKLIAHISGCILLCSPGYLSKRHIYQLREEDKDYQ